MPRIFPSIFRTLRLAALALALASCGGDNASQAVLHTSENVRSAAISAPTTAEYNVLVQRIYLAYFGRPADPSGLLYWSERYRAASLPATVDEVVQRYNADPTLRAFVDVFGQSQESKDLYPGDNDSFIRAIYSNLFSREADAVGKAYWVQLLNAGAITRPIAALTIMSGARSTDITIVDKKAAAATFFTQSLDTPARTQTYDGLDANAIVRAMLRQVVLGTTTEQMQSLVYASITSLAASQPVISVSSYSPSTAKVQEATRFTFTGTNLPAGLSFSLEDCIGIVEVSGGSAASRSFNCTPLSSGSKRGTLKLLSSGAVLATFTVAVTTVVAAPPVVDSFTPSVANVNTPTTFTFTGRNLTGGMHFSLTDCMGVYEVGGGTSTQRQFTCTPASAGIKSGVIRSFAGGASLGTFSVNVAGTPATDWNSSASATEFFSSTNTLASRKRNFVGSFSVTSGNNIADIMFVAQYTARVYLMPKGQGDRFGAGLSFEYYTSINLPSDVNFLVTSKTLASGEYDIGFENMTTSPNTARIEVQAPMKVVGFRAVSIPFNTDISSLKPNSRQTQPFSIRDDLRILIDGANTGGEVYIIDRSQEANFLAGNQFFYYTDVCDASGTAAPGFCEVKLKSGEYAIAYHNNTSEPQSLLYFGLNFAPE